MKTTAFNRIGQRSLSKVKACFKGNWGCFVVVFSIALLLNFSPVIGAEWPSAVDLKFDEADVLLYGGQQDDQMSVYQAHAVGDVNGDGTDDLLLGSYLAQGPGGLRVQGGEVYVYFGGASFTANKDAAGTDGTAPDLTIYGVAGSQLSYGGGIFCADVDADGIQDILLGAPGMDGPDGTRTDAGAAYVILGSPALSGTLDLSASTQDAIIHGAAPGDQLCRTGSITAGDFNGDGVEDIVLGSYLYDAHFDDPLAKREDSGGAFVIFGASPLDASYDLAAGEEDITILGAGAGDQLTAHGTMLIANFNGDGIQDLILAAPLADGPGNLRTEAGELYVVYGHSFSSSVTYDLGAGDYDIIIYGADEYDYLGVNGSLRAGDVNLDGMADIFAGAPGGDGSDDLRTDAGEAYLVLGEPVLSKSFDLEAGDQRLTFYGKNQDDFLANKGALALGDFTGNGYPEMVVGSENADGLNHDRPNAGEAYILSWSLDLGPALDLSTDSGFTTIYGAQAQDQLTQDGSILLADLNNDGKKDLVLGAPNSDSENNSRSSAGEAVVFYGRAAPPANLDVAASDQDVIIYGATSADALCAWGGLGSGDLNGDGNQDLILSSDQADGPINKRSEAGEAYVLFGWRPPAADPAEYTYDLNPDTSWLHETAVMYGGDAGDGLAPGGAIASGDVNGDGVDDLVIGAPDARGPGGTRDFAGEVYVWFGGKKNLTGAQDVEGISGTPPDITIYGDTNYFLTKTGSLAVGDVNGDSYEDIVMGAYGATPAASREAAGAAFIVYGEKKPPNTVDLAAGEQDLVVYGANYLDFLTRNSCLALGDLNNDGIQDLLLGAPGYEAVTPTRAESGAAYVIFGSGSLPATLDLKNGGQDILIIGDSKYDLFPSYGMMDVEDVNGDGNPDFILGTSLADGPSDTRAESGEVYILYGPPAATPYTVDLATQSADVTIYGASTQDRLGEDHTIAFGDANGDGYKEIALGSSRAFGMNDQAPNAGALYLIFTNPAMPPIIDLGDTNSGPVLTLYGANIDSQLTLGGSLAVGDLNGDGYADSVVGAPNEDGPDGNRIDCGRAYILFGSNITLTLPLQYPIDLASSTVLYGASGGDRLTYGGSTIIKDFNGDGLDDLALGAPFADGPEDQRPDAGELYAFGGVPSWPAVIDIEDMSQITTGSLVYGATSGDMLTHGGSLHGGDLNGDGTFDLIIGSSLADGPTETRPEAGEAYLLY